MNRQPDRVPSRALLAHVLRRAVTVFRVDWVFLLALALLIFIPVGFVEAVLEDVEADGDELTPGLGLLAVTVIASAMLGEVLYSGAVAGLLAKTPRGERPSIPRLVRELPWGRLIAADVLVSLVVVVGFLLLIAPGFVFLGWFAFVAPVIEIEDRGVRDGFRRSRELVRGRFWVVLVVVLGLTLATEAAIAALVDLSHSLLGEGLVPAWLAESTGDLVTSPVTAVVVVLMAVEIMRERGEAPEHA